MRFSATTLGCKANQYDTGTVVSILRLRGHEQVRLGSGCDVCIVNTCAVTAESVRKSKQAVRRAKRTEPNALIAVCGCFPQTERIEAEALGADIIGGIDDREAFADEIEMCVEGKIETNPNSQFSSVSRSEPLSNSQLTKTRALLKIQDGCDNYCAYCIIPYARGHSRCALPSEIAKKAAQLEGQGYKEIVITGIEISSYKPGLIDALSIVSENAPGARIRLGSLQPQWLSNEHIDKMRQIPKLCNHFHISLQSGCDATLSRMNRKYKTADVHAAITALRERFDNCAITADLIVGFPGETDEEFRQTLAFIEKAAFSAMHIFPYSKRPKTKAALLPSQVPESVKRERAKAAAAIAAALSDSFKCSQIGKTLDVLFETRKDGYSTGHSGNYLTVSVPGKIQKNTLSNIKITALENGVLFGEI